MKIRDEETAFVAVMYGLAVVAAIVWVVEMYFELAG